MTINREWAGNHKRLLLLGSAAAIFVLMIATYRLTAVREGSFNPQTPVVNQDVPIVGYPYSGWLKYNDPIEKFSIMYPPSWALTVSPGTSDHGGPSDAIQISSQGGFVLKYSLTRPHGDFYTDCSGCKFSQASRFFPDRNHSQFLVVDSQDTGLLSYQTLGVSSVSDLSLQEHRNYPYFKSFKNPGLIVRWFGQYFSNVTGVPEPVPMTFDEFIKKPEVTTATSIIHSISYD